MRFRNTSTSTHSAIGDAEYKYVTRVKLKPLKWGWALPQLLMAYSVVRLSHRTLTPVTPVQIWVCLFMRLTIKNKKVNIWKMN